MNREITIWIASMFCLLGGLIFLSLYRENRAAELHDAFNAGARSANKRRDEIAGGDEKHELNEAQAKAAAAAAGPDGTDR